MLGRCPVASSLGSPGRARGARPVSSSWGFAEGSMQSFSWLRVGFCLLSGRVGGPVSLERWRPVGRHPFRICSGAHENAPVAGATGASRAGPCGAGPSRAAAAA